MAQPQHLRSSATTTDAVPREWAPTEFLDLAWLEQATAEQWARLFNATGWPSSLTRKSVSHDKILQALQGDQLHDSLLDALQLAYDLATPEGIEELLHTSGSQHLAAADLGDTQHPVPLLFELWQRAQEPRHRVFALVLRLAQLAIHRRITPTKSLRDYVASKPVPCPPVSACRKQLQPALKKAFEAGRFGPVYDIVVDDSRTRVTFLIVYGGRQHNYLLATQTGREARKLSFVVCDTIHYDPRDGRLTISTRAKTLVAAYRRIFGEVIANDPEMFSGESLWSLEPLRQRGMNVLLEHPLRTEIREVVPRKVVWRPDENNRVVLDGNDCLELIKSHPWTTQGELIELELELVLWGPRARRANLAYKASNRLVTRPERYRSLGERFFRVLGLQQTSSRRLDLWAVAEGVHAEDDITEALGADIETLSQTGIVSQAMRRTRLRDNGATDELMVLEDEGRPQVAVVGEDETVPPTLDDERVMQGFTVVLDTLARRIALDLKLEGSPTHLQPFPLVDLGKRTVGTTAIRVFLQLGALTDERSALNAIEARRVDGSRVVVIVPTGRTALGGLPYVDWNLWRPSFDGLWSRVLRALAIANDDPWAEAREDAQFLIHESRELVRYHGVDISLRGEQEFMFLLTIAKQVSTGPLTMPALAQKLVGKGATNQAVHMAKKRALESIKRSLQEAAVLVPTARLNGLIRRRGKAGGGYDFGEPFHLLGRPPGGS